MAKKKKKRKNPVSDSCVDENTFLMSEGRGGCADCFETIEKQNCNSNNHSLEPKSAEEHL